VAENTFTPPGECPVCGETVPRGVRACPGCGADERSGWDEEATRYDGLDLPASTFDDDRSAPSHRAPAWLWPVAGFVTLAAVIVALILR
jgi:hypothetical protein